MRLHGALGSALAVASASILLGGLTPVLAGSVDAGTVGYAITPIDVPGAFAVAVDESTHTLVVTGDLNDNLSVVDGATDAVTTSIPLGIIPAFGGLAVNPATDLIYVDGTVAGSHDGAEMVEVVDGATDTIISTIALPNGSLPGAMAVNSVTNTVYVTESTQSAIAVINGATNTVTSSVSLGHYTVPQAVAVDSRTNQVYVGNANTDALSVVDGATNTLANTVPMPVVGGPTGIAVDAATDTIYVNVYGSGIVRLDGNTDTVTGEISGGPLGWALAWDPARNTLFSSGGGTYVIAGSAMSAGRTIPVGGQALAIDSSTAAEYIASSTEGFSMFAVTNGISPVITSPASATFTAGALGSFTVTATGTPTPVFSEVGDLPNGMSFSASGQLSGTPSAFAGGSYPVTITATNTVIPAAVQTLTITVHQAPSITSAARVAFRAGRRNRFKITSRGYPTAALREFGRLPRGIRFIAHSNGTATLSGVPSHSATARRYVLRITAQNGIGRAAVQRFTLVVRR